MLWPKKRQHLHLSKMCGIKSAHSGASILHSALYLCINQKYALYFLHILMKSGKLVI